jgi:hypothetical protein
MSVAKIHGKEDVLKAHEIIKDYPSTKNIGPGYLKSFNQIEPIFSAKWRQPSETAIYRFFNFVQ